MTKVTFLATLLALGIAPGVALPPQADEAALMQLETGWNQLEAKC